MLFAKYTKAHAAFGRGFAISSDGYFSVVIVFFDTIMHQRLTPMEFRGQGHLLTLVKGHMSVVCQHFQWASPLKLLGQFELNFICILVASR